jgi:hypothetical protein
MRQRPMWIILTSTPDSKRERLFDGPFKTRKDARERLDRLAQQRQQAGAWRIERNSPDDLVVDIFYGYAVSRTLAY